MAIFFSIALTLHPWYIYWNKAGMSFYSGNTLSLHFHQALSKIARYP